MIRPFESLILRNLLGPLIAALQLFLLYVVVHGHYSPGGAFQGGTLLAASLILPRLAAPKRGFPVIGPRAAIAMSAVGVLLFTGVGLVALLYGRPWLDYGALPFGAMAEPARRALGILLIEVGVTLTVAGALISVYYSLDGDVHVGSSGEGRS